MDTLLEQLDGLREIGDMLSSVTDDQLVRAGSKIEPPRSGERVLGKLHNLTVQRLYVVGRRLVARSAEAIAHSELADADDQQQIHAAEGQRLQSLSKLVVTLFWYHVNNDTGAWTDELVGIRTDWEVVAQKKKTGDAGLHSGVVRLNQETAQQLGDLFQRLMEGGEPEDNDD